VRQEDLVLPLLGEKTLSSVASAVRREDLWACALFTGV